MSDQFFVIVAEHIDNTQRSLIHEQVKKHAEDWWHQFEDVWVVKGDKNAGAWRDLLGPMVSLPHSSLLILKVKNTPGGRWATVMPTSKSMWFREVLSGRGTKSSGLRKVGAEQPRLEDA